MVHSMRFLPCVVLVISFQANILAADSSKPVKVYILAGQSNMQGKAKVSVAEYQAQQPATRELYTRLWKDGKWIERDDVWFKYFDQKGSLTVGYGTPKSIGPELGFGMIVGDRHDEQVLLIKTAWGGRSLYRDFRSPSAGLPSQVVLEKMLVDAKKRTPATTMEDVKKAFGASYREMLAEVQGTLADLKTHFPAYAGQGYELAGFIWFQGWNDMISADATADYTSNLKHFINDVRKDLKSPKLPFVIGEMGVDGQKASGNIVRFKAAQAAVMDDPGFKGNVTLVKTDVFWDTEAEAVFKKGWRENLAEWNKLGSDFPFHYLGSPRTMLAIGDAFGKAVLELQDGRKPTTSRGMVKLSDEALRIHQEALLIDGHNDLPWAIREKADPFFKKFDITRSQPELHTDIPRLRKGNVGAQFWSAYVPADTATKRTAVKDTLEQIDQIHRLIRTYPDTFALALTADDIVRIRKEGKIASLIGVEGGHSIDHSLGVLRMLHSLGVRYMTLTHTDNLDWADSATDKPKHGGLTPFGEQVVLEMNRLAMLVDISHVSADTMRHAIRITKAPVIASHSSAYALADHPRNVPDDVLKLLPRNGGVIMVNFYSGFITADAARFTRLTMQTARELRAKYPKEEDFKEAYRQWRKGYTMPAGTLHDVVDHIEHIMKVAGPDHVGLGSDYDGIDSTPKQLEDVSCFPLITQELLNRGHSRETIHKVLGGNVLRAMRQAEDVARTWTPR